MTKEKTSQIIIIVGLVLVILEAIVIIALLLPRGGHTQAPQGKPALQQTEEPTTIVTEPPLPKSGLTAEDFVMVDGFMTCTAEQYMTGIDVSSHQGRIDWKKVADSGIRFAILRLAYRGYGEEGRLVVDERVQENYKGAKEAGLMVGGYIFSQALCVEEAIEEAELVLEITADWELDMPVAFDWEFLHLEARTDGMDKDTITDCAIAFCERLKEGGLKPMLYTGVRMQTLDMQRVQDDPMWLALYSDTMSYPYWMSYWQYSCTGRVPGVAGDVDLNIFLTGSKFMGDE